MSERTAFHDDSDATAAEDLPGESHSVDTGALPGEPRPAPLAVDPLAPGDLVADRYRITKHCGRGMSGQTYRGVDNHTKVRVVVKPIRTDMRHAKLVASQEREGLKKAFGHPNLVTVLDVVDVSDVPGLAGYLVMESLDGPSLADRISDEGAAGVSRALVPALLDWIHRALPGIAHLHRQEMAFCDIKPAHLLAREPGDPDLALVKWIDVGAVAPFGRSAKRWFATDGYHDDLLATDGPSVASDVFALGRTILAVVVPNGTLRQGSRLPTPQECPILGECPSLERLLRRACDPEPSARFVSVAELGEALAAVIRDLHRINENHQLADAIPHSRLFRPSDRGFGTTSIVGRLTLDSTGPPFATLSAGDVAVGLPVPIDHPAERLPPEQRTVSLMAALARAAIERGDDRGALEVLAAFAASAPNEWRIPWYRGVVALRAGRPEDARSYFDAVAFAIPGEPAPELALAAAAELCNDYAGACALYRSVWRNDSRFVSAAFGLARCAEAQGEHDTAIHVLEQVPPTSSYVDAARLSAARLRLTYGEGPERFAQANALLGEVSELRLRAELLLAAWQWTAVHGGARQRFLGVELTESAVRDALSIVLRRLARGRSGPAARELIDLSHATRRTTWW